MLSGSNSRPQIRNRPENNVHMLSLDMQTTYTSKMHLTGKLCTHAKPRNANDIYVPKAKCMTNQLETLSCFRRALPDATDSAAQGRAALKSSRRRREAKQPTT